MFSLRYRDILPSSVADELDSLVGQIRGIFSPEHNTDGTHGDVTADTLSLQGATVGVPVNLAYDAARFVGFGGTWTVTEADMRYLRIVRVGQLVFVQFYLENTAVSVDTPDELWIRLPELHAIPAVNAAGAAYGFAQGVGYWEDTDQTPDRQGLTLVQAAADDFSSSVPGTLLILTRHGTGSDVDTSEALFAQWPVSSNLTIHGSCWFVLEPNNIPSPFFGS